MKPRFKNMRRPGRPWRRGAAIVEFAFCVPVLITVLFAIIEFSRAVQLQQSVRQAAFEGARAGVDLDATVSSVTTAVNTNAQIFGITLSSITVSPNPLTNTGSSASPTVTVTVSASPVTNSWFLKFFTGSNALSATITLDREVQGVSNP